MQAAMASNNSAERTDRMEALEWDRITEELNGQGCAVLPGLLQEQECREVADLYGKDSTFRSRVVMASHGFGRGEYKYFSYPLPKLIAELRPALYAQLAPIANWWNEAMNLRVRYPESH